MAESVIKEVRGIRNLVHLNPAYEDSWAWKDGIQLLWVLKKELNCNSELITFDNSESYHRTLKFTEITRIRRSRSFPSLNTLKIILMLFRKRKQTDFLFQFGFSWQSLLYSYIFRIFNRRGYSYIKFDNSIHSGIDYFWWKYFNGDTSLSIRNRIKRLFIKRLFIKKTDLFSIEDADSLGVLKERLPLLSNKIILLPNGINFEQLDGFEINSFAKKENIILTAGRLGSYAKATDIFLEALERIPYSVIKDWKIIFAGPVEEGFGEKIRLFFEGSDKRKEYISFIGEQTREELFRLYNRAKIFALPSRWEGFANVFSEAMIFGNALITTEKTAPKNIIRERCGIIIESESATQLADAIISLVSDNEKLADFCRYSREYALDNLNWRDLSVPLAEQIRRHFTG